MNTEISSTCDGAKNFLPLLHNLALHRQSEVQPRPKVQSDPNLRPQNGLFLMAFIERPIPQT